MRIKRCGVLWLEPRELAHFDLDALLSGGTGVVTRRAWLAHAPHLLEPVEVSAAEVLALGILDADGWMPASTIEEAIGRIRLKALLELGLIVGSTKKWAEQRELEEKFRSIHWHGLAALWHVRSRWQGVDASEDVVGAGVNTSAGLRARHGVPPPTFAQEASVSRYDIELPRGPMDAFDTLLDARSSCRNFDSQGVLPLTDFSQVMERVFGARGEVHAADDFDVIKRTSPSGGALHPTECYLLVQRVEGLRPGLYHYHPGTHGLRPMQPQGKPPTASDRSVQSLSGHSRQRWTPRHWRNLARIAVAGQDYFADAAVTCILAPRFARSFWKYRNHPKAYRVAILDAGHLSQTLQLCATQAGLGAFVTAAINEIDIETVLGLQAHVDGPLLVCGFGPRAARMQTSELDPGRKTWSDDGFLRRDEDPFQAAARGKLRSSRR